MRKLHIIIIIGISIPVAFFGIMTLILAVNISEANSNSDRWMVELEPSLNLSDDQLFFQMQDEDIKELHLYRVVTLEHYIETLEPIINVEFEEGFNLKDRFVFLIDKNSGYSKKQIQEILTDVNGIRDAEYLNDWLLAPLRSER